MTKKLLLILSMFCFTIISEVYCGELPKLTDEEQEATSGRSMHHSSWVKKNFGEMHMKGNEWPHEKLQKMFALGLFQHYTFEFTGFSYEKNYEQYLENNFHFYQVDLEALKVLYLKNGLPIPDDKTITTPQSLRQSLAIVNWFRAVGDALKRNVNFRNLGGDFQRQKVIVEKMVDRIRKGETSETFEKQTWAADGQASDMQKVLFHWMRYTFLKAQEILREDMAKGQIPDSKHPFLREIIEQNNFWPDFQPLVKKLSKAINTLQQQKPQQQTQQQKPTPENVQQPRSIQEIYNSMVNDPNFENEFIPVSQAIKRFINNPRDRQIRENMEALRTQYKESLKRKLNIQDNEVDNLDEAVHEFIMLHLGLEAVPYKNKR